MPTYAYVISEKRGGRERERECLKKELKKNVEKTCNNIKELERETFQIRINLRPVWPMEWGWWRGRE